MSYAAPVSITAATSDAARQARVARRLSPSPFLAEPLRALGYDSRELWAWDTYEQAVLAFVGHCRDAGRHKDELHAERPRRRRTVSVASALVFSASRRSPHNSSNAMRT